MFLVNSEEEWQLYAARNHGIESDLEIWYNFERELKPILAIVRFNVAFITRRNERNRLNMKFYIGLGGIGCRVLMRFAKKHAIPAEACFYVDADQGQSLDVPIDRFHLVQGLPVGTGALRNVGRSAVVKELYCGKMRDFFQPIFDQNEISIDMFTSSFGGFGGAAAGEIMDYLEANTAGRQTETARVLALTEKMFASMGFPKTVMDKFESNTLDFISSFGDRIVDDGITDALMCAPLFLSKCRLLLIDKEEDLDSLAGTAEPAAEILQRMDQKDRYRLPAQLPGDDPQVFISYSFKDKAIAELLVNAIEKQGHKCWIAPRDMHEGSYPAQIMQAIRKSSVFLLILTRQSMRSEQVKNELDRAHNRLRDGMRIVPFLVNDVELDDECMYYLCRQEIFSGYTPPLVERVKEMADRISNML